MVGDSNLRRRFHSRAPCHEGGGGAFALEGTVAKDVPMVARGTACGGTGGPGLPGHLGPWI
jgi:hypothetical protein